MQRVLVGIEALTAAVASGRVVETGRDVHALVQDADDLDGAVGWRR
jgi:hypothetical protein